MTPGQDSVEHRTEQERQRIAHEHSDVTGGWLRPAVFGASDGLVSNFALIAGVAGGSGDSGVVRLAGEMGADPKHLGARLGALMVLHTWGQQLSFHPHIHCIVSGGGITNDNRWKECTNNDRRFLFPVKALSIVYRAKFLQALQQMISNGDVISTKEDSKQLINLLYHKDWNVYAKAPFGGPHAVIEYLGRYTHKVAISNHRIGSIDKQSGTVSFDYRDYADGGKQKQMTLTIDEFIRRFEQHILPERFTKIRTYGYLANRNRHQRINEVLSKMKLPLHKGMVKIPVQVRMLEQFGIDMSECPCCKNKTLQLLKIFYPCLSGRQPWTKAGDG